MILIAVFMAIGTILGAGVGYRIGMVWTRHRWVGVTLPAIGMIALLFDTARGLGFTPWELTQLAVAGVAASVAVAVSLCRYAQKFTASSRTGVSA